MTNANPDPRAKPSHTQRRGSDREQRIIRLCWLLGWQTVAIAAHLGGHVPAVRRRMRAVDPCRPDAPGERQRLLQAETGDRLADDLLGSGEVAKRAPLIAKHAPATTTAAPCLPTEQADADDNDDPNGDWRDWAARLRAGRGPVDTVAAGLETTCAGDGRDARPRRSGRCSPKGGGEG